MRRVCRECGSASIWVVACCALLLAVAFSSTLRVAAVVARHRAEAAADLAALAAADQIGVSDGICPAAARIAAANRATLQRCVSSLAGDGRSGTVTVRLSVRVQLPVVGARQVVASARAGRDSTSGTQSGHVPVSGRSSRSPNALPSGRFVAVAR